MSSRRFTAAFLTALLGVLLQWRSPEIFGQQFDFALAGLTAASFITGIGETLLLSAAATGALMASPAPKIETVLLFFLPLVAWTAARLLPARPAASGAAAAALVILIFYAIVEPVAFVSSPGTLFEDAILMGGVSAFLILFLQSTYPPEQRENLASKAQ